MKRRFWTEAETTTLREMMAAGEAGETIAARIGRPLAAIYSRAARLKLEWPEMHRKDIARAGGAAAAPVLRKRAESRRQQVEALAESGRSKVEIAQELGLSLSYIWKVLKGRPDVPHSHRKTGRARWPEIREQVKARLLDPAETYGTVARHFAIGQKLMAQMLKEDGWKRPTHVRYPAARQKAASAAGRAKAVAASKARPKPRPHATGLSPAADTRNPLIPQIIFDLQRHGRCFRADIHEPGCFRKPPTHYVFRKSVYPLEDLPAVLAREEGKQTMTPI